MQCGNRSVWRWCWSDNGKGWNLYFFRMCGKLLSQRCLCSLCCRCVVTEPGPPAPGFPVSAGSTPPASHSLPAGTLPAAQGQRLLNTEPIPQFQHGTTLHVSYTDSKKVFFLSGRSMSIFAFDQITFNVIICIHLYPIPFFFTICFYSNAYNVLYLLVSKCLQSNCYISFILFRMWTLWPFHVQNINIIF